MTVARAVRREEIVQTMTRLMATSYVPRLSADEALALRTIEDWGVAGMPPIDAKGVTLRDMFALASRNLVASIGFDRLGDARVRLTDIGFRALVTFEGAPSAEAR